MDENSTYYEYGALWKHMGLVYASLVIIFILPLPIYSEIIFDSTMKETNIYILEAIGIIAVIGYVYIDVKENKYIGNITINDETITSENKYKTIKFKWSDISRIINIRDGDKSTMSHWGLKEGITLIDNKGSEMVICTHINNYKNLNSIIMSKVYAK